MKFPKGRSGNPKDTVWSEEKIHELGQELVDFVSKPDIWHITQFTTFKNFDSSWLYKLEDNWPSLTQYISKANKTLGAKMMKAAMEKKADPWVIKFYMPRLLGDRKSIRQQTVEDAYDKAKGALKALDHNVDSQGAIAEFLKSQKVGLDCNRVKPEEIEAIEDIDISDSSATE